MRFEEIKSMNFDQIKRCIVYKLQRGQTVGSEHISSRIINKKI